MSTSSDTMRGLQFDEQKSCCEDPLTANLVLKFASAVVINMGAATVGVLTESWTAGVITFGLGWIAYGMGHAVGTIEQRFFPSAAPVRNATTATTPLVSVVCEK